MNEELIATIDGKLAESQGKLDAAELAAQAIPALRADIRRLTAAKKVLMKDAVRKPRADAGKPRVPKVLVSMHAAVAAHRALAASTPMPPIETPAPKPEKSDKRAKAEQEPR